MIKVAYSCCVIFYKLPSFTMLTKTFFMEPNILDNARLIFQMLKTFEQF